MVKGYNANQERSKELSSFGKDLARRSKSSCELCAARGVKLSIFELPPAPRDPEFHRCILACDACINGMTEMDHDYWRVLNNSVWSETLPVQVLAVALLDQLAMKSTWAAELREQLYLDSEIESWINERPRVDEAE